MNKGIVVVGIVVILLASLGVWITYNYSSNFGKFGLSLTLVVVGLGTFFGTLATPGGSEPDGTVRERRIRLSIAATLVVIYVVYFGLTAFWKEAASELEREMISTITTLLSIVLPFYFGASAAVEISKRSRVKE